MKEKLQDQLLYNLLYALSVYSTDFDSVVDDTKESLVKNVASAFNVDMFDAKICEHNIIKFFEDGECILIVEVVA